jgi:hypothetical protein
MQNSLGLGNVPLTKKIATNNGNIYRRLTDRGEIKWGRVKSGITF